MAKKQQIIDVTGISTQDILNWEFEELNKLSNKNLRAVTSRLVSSANKRLRRIEKANKTEFNVPYKKVIEGGGKFSVKGKSRNEVLKEYARAKDYLESKTSTIRGYESYRSKVKMRLGQPERSDKDENEFWKEYNYINEHSRNNYNEILGSDQMQRIVAKAKAQGKTHKQILTTLRNEYKKAQQRQIEKIRELETDLEDETEL